MTRCTCNISLHAGQICGTCGDRCDDGGALTVYAPQPPRKELATRPAAREVDLAEIEPDVWLGAHQEMFLAVINKVTASLVTTGNSLDVKGFILEKDEPIFTRQAIIKMRLNGRERALIVPLFNESTRQADADAIRKAVQNWIADEVLRDLEVQFARGQFRQH